MQGQAGSGLWEGGADEGESGAEGGVESLWTVEEGESGAEGAYR